MRKPISLSVIAASMLAAGVSHADALIGPQLQSQLDAGNNSFDVIVSFNHKDSVHAVMQGLNAPYVGLHSLPMAGVKLNKAELQSLAVNPAVKSLYYNAPLTYYNFHSGEITGGHYVHDNYGVTGAGVTIAVLDSGVDASHMDLSMGDKTIENVKIVGDLDLAGGVNVFLEGVVNTDTSSGHGTHVAGTVAGSGAASANDSRREYAHDGIAPGANLVGLGAGEGVHILFGLLGFDYAIANKDRLGIDVITNSWGGGAGSEFDPNNPINQASFEAYKQGIVVSFAASNDGPGDDTLNRYALPPWVLNVAASEDDKTLADFSSRGVEGHEWKQPDITAPGVGIISTRAVNTAIGALGPIVDTENPEYYRYYHSISGTSMATPFIAGTVALMLEANPSLSPDQIEHILKASAEEMPGYLPHQVGAGHVDVKAAVEMARDTVGERHAFMQGDTRWATQGHWSVEDDSHELIDYAGRWSRVEDSDASNGGYMQSSKKGGGILATIRGDRVKLNFLSSAKGGTAEVWVDGQSYGTVSLYGETNGESIVKAITGLSAGKHDIEIRAIQGKVSFDGMDIDGELIDNGITYVETTLNYNGTMGPSAENLSVHEHQFMVDENTVNISASLSWDGVADLDFYLVAPDGREVASSASLGNPEVLGYWVDQPGVYTLKVTGYISALTTYRVTNTLTRAERR